MQCTADLLSPDFCLVNLSDIRDLRIFCRTNPLIAVLPVACYQFVPDIRDEVIEFMLKVLSINNGCCTRCATPFLAGVAMYLHSVDYHAVPRAWLCDECAEIEQTLIYVGRFIWKEIDSSIESAEKMQKLIYSIICQNPLAAHVLIYLIEEFGGKPNAT